MTNDRMIEMSPVRLSRLSALFSGGYDTVLTLGAIKYGTYCGFPATLLGIDVTHTGFEVMRDSEFIIRVHAEKHKVPNQGVEAAEDRSLMARVKDFFHSSPSKAASAASTGPTQQAPPPPVPQPKANPKLLLDHPTFVDGGLVLPVDTDNMSLLSLMSSPHSPEFEDTPSLSLTIRGQDSARAAVAAAQRRRIPKITPCIVAAGPCDIVSPPKPLVLDDTRRVEGRLAFPETPYGTLPISGDAWHEHHAHSNFGERGHVLVSSHSNGVKFSIKAPAHIEAGIPSNLRVVLIVVHTEDARVKVYPLRTGFHLPNIRRSIVNPPGLEGVQEPQQPLRTCQCSPTCTNFSPSHMTGLRWKANLAVDSLRQYQNGKATTETASLSLLEG